MQQYAIKKDVLEDGTVILAPVTRNKGYLSTRWERICKLEDRYCLQELDWNPNLTEEECNERIEGYRKYLKDLVANTVKSSIFISK